MKIQSNFMVLFLILLFSIVSFGQGEGILRYIEYHTITLTERQHELLEIIRSLPQTKEVYLVQIDESRFNIDMELIRINLPERVIEVQRNSKYQRLENRISWSGKITNVPA